MRSIVKKGDATDPLIILVILFFLAVSMVTGILVNTKLQTIISTTALNQSLAYEDINDSFEKVNTVGVQRGFVMMFAIMCIFVVGSSFLVRVHPVFIFIYILMLAITIFVAVFVGNSYEKLKSSEELATLLEQQNKIDFIMSHIVTIIMAVGGLSMLVVFSKIFSPPVGDSGGFG